MLPSHAELVRRVLIEETSMGKPIVATRAGGAMEIVEDRSKGLLISPGDTNRLAEAIVRRRENEKQRIRMGKAVRKRIKNMFSIGKNVEETQNVNTQSLS